MIYVFGLFIAAILLTIGYKSGDKNSLGCGYLLIIMTVVSIFSPDKDKEGKNDEHFHD